MANRNLQPVLAVLHKAFDKFNKKYYEGALPEVIIAVRSQGSRVGVMGWFTPAKVWTDGEDSKHEIVITAETLNREPMDIMRTLHHEMIHLYCETNGIKDTSRSGAYHNKNFKAECLKRGFYYETDSPDSKIGWSSAQLTDDTKAVIEKWKLDFSVFGISRISFTGKEKKVKKTNRIKWTCPKCSETVTSTKIEGIKPFCMNEIAGQPCKEFYVPLIPEGFTGRIPLTRQEEELLDFISEYMDGAFTKGQPMEYITLGALIMDCPLPTEDVPALTGQLMEKWYLKATGEDDGETYLYLTDRARDYYINS